MKTRFIPRWAGIAIFLLFLACLLGAVVWVVYLFFDLIRNL
jgi:predicted PurR-regulated permease PerM